MKPIIAYIDDEPVNLTVFEIATEETDWEILTFDNPQTAIDTLKNKKPWVVITDQRMPQIAGVELLEKIQEHCPEAVRIITTAYSDENLLLDSVRRAHIFDYIKKPWDEDLLIASLERAINVYQLNKELQQHRENLEDLVKERTAELAIARDEADKANEFKSAFLANMSHEIRTPLTAILGFSETALDKSQTEEEHDQAINTIIRSGKHLLELINDILDLSKVEAGKLDVEKIPTSVVDVLTEIATLQQKSAASKNLEFELSCDTPIPEKITSDPTRLKQIVLNLCSNAIKFTESGFVKIHVACDWQSETLAISVSDSGIGMTAEQMEKVFDAFGQAESSTTRKYGGTGLGLSLSKQLTKKLGGNLIATSEFNKGSKFTVSIPTGFLSQVDKIEQIDAFQKPKNKQTEESNKSIQGHVLLAEDTLDNQRLISWHLKKWGLTRDIANNGKEAIDLALNNTYDVVLMDMQMEVMDGLEAVRCLRDKGYTVPVVALTANASERDKEDCLQAGCDKYISKPIDLSAFQATVTQLLPSTKDAKSISDKPFVSYEAANDASVDFNPIVSTLAQANDPDLSRIIQTFVDSLPDKLDHIHQAVKEQDWKKVKEQAHVLKGIGGGFGYAIVTQVAGQLESQILSENYNAVNPLVGELTNIFKRIRVA